MSSPHDVTRLLKVSERFYRRLLFVYPARFRKEYGEAMALLFRDQCKESLGDGGLIGLARLWVRTLVDTATSSCREHLFEFQQASQFIMKTIVTKPLLRFATLFAATFLLLAAVWITTVIFWLPKVYKSTARVSVQKRDATMNDSKFTQTEYDPYFTLTEAHRLTSQEVLNQAIEELDLRKFLARETGASAILTPNESSRLLQRMIEGRQFRNTSIFELSVSAKDPAAAADIANKIVEVYRRKLEAANAPTTVLLRDSASEASRTVRPKVALGLFLVLLSSLAFAAISSLLLRRFISRGIVG